MAQSPSSRDALIAGLMEAQRELSTWSLLFHHAVAESAGLHPTDHKCLDLIERFGPLTAGKLATVSGLTTGAITAVVDRLEAHGYVERRRDPKDRRKVILHHVPEVTYARLGPAFQSLGARFAAALAGYDEASLEVIRKYTGQSLEIMRDELARIAKERHP
jgi:DNA-binding transcriptional ArsR family regulator